MPVPDFAVGEVLTASAMDSIGLWKVTSGSLSGTSTNFAGCFTSDYENYRIVVSGLALSGSGDIYVKYLVTGTTPTTASSYFWALRGLTSGASSADNTGSAQALAYTGWSQGASGGAGSLAMDVTTPFLSTQETVVTCSAASYATNYVSRSGMFAFDALTSMTGIQFLTNTAATFSTGQVEIYGYRK
jgi:hypothetical protein